MFPVTWIFQVAPVMEFYHDFIIWFIAQWKLVQKVIDASLK